MIQEYLPFFRKYRPQSFKDIVGQESLVKTLTGAIELNRISHAYLFCGPRGTGKTSTARIFAKSLNCEKGTTLEPCQKCSSCLEITNGTGIDVIEIDAATNRGIDDARNLIEQTQYAPIKGKYKIFIIDEVHMLSKEAFNALLKTIEEPPKNVIFILATTEPHKVLETIVSRCQRFDLRRITTADIVKKLREISDLENIKITDDALNAIAKNVSGGLRDSLALLDQVSILGLKEEITKETVESLIGKITFDVLFNLVQAVTKENLSESLEALDNIYTNGAEPRNFTENLIEFLRNTVIVLNADKKSRLNFINLNETEISKLQNSNFDKNLIVKLTDKTLEFFKEIKNATNPYLMVELLLIELCNINSLNKENTVSQKTETMTKTTPVKIQKPVQAMENASETLAAQTRKIMPEPQKEAIAEILPKIEEKTAAKIDENEERKAMSEIIAKDMSSTSKKQDVWDNIVNSIESIPAKCFFGDIARLIEINENVVKIGFLYANAVVQAKSDLKTKPFKKALSHFFEKAPEIQYIQLQTDGSEYIRANLSKGAQAKPKTLIAENFEEMTDKITPAKEKEDKTAFYSSKTKEIVENFNGKVID